MKTETTDKAILTELRAITKDKAKWQTALADVAARLGEPFDFLMSMRSDTSDEVRLAFVWACENIATNAPELFFDTLELFYELISDKSERVQIEAPEMFRVMGKRLPHSVETYLKKLQWVAGHDAHPVVRIHTSGAIRITKKALAETIGSY